MSRPQTAQQRAEQFEKPLLAVQMMQNELGRDVQRVEFVTTGDRGETYFPTLHDWPRDVQQSLRATARRWCADNGIDGVLATVCLADHSQEPPVLTLALLFEQPTVAVTDPPGPPASRTTPPDAGALPPSAPAACARVGCGE